MLEYELAPSVLAALNRKAISILYVYKSVGQSDD